MNRLTTTFRQLSALKTIARLGSVSLAAKELNLTQPTVSLQIRMLDEAIGTPLLERSGRGIQLTPAGAIVAEYASRILSLWREGAEAVDALRGLSGGTLKIGAVTTAEYLLPALLVPFVEKQPGTRIQLSVGNRAEMIRMLAAHEIDLMIAGRSAPEFGTGSVAFAKHPMAFIAAPTHPLMRRRNLSLQDLADANLLVRERGSGARIALERLFTEAGVKLSIGSELSSNAAIKRMVSTNLGIAFLSLHACTLEFQVGEIGMLPFRGSPVERDWYVMHLGDRQLPGVARAFREFLVDHGESEIAQQLKIFRPALQRLRRRAHNK